MKIKLTSVMVDDQEKALQFYTTVLGFTVRNDIPMGSYRWLTVVSPEEPDGAELLLEPLGFEPARTYQKALFEANIPAAVFTVAAIENEYERLKNADVLFTKAPTQMGPVTIAVLNDTCGNLIQIIQGNA